MKLGIRRRIALALAALALLVASAAVIAMLTHRALHRELDEVGNAEKKGRAALELSLAVRDLYAHQAHTIILGNTSHLGHYESSRAMTRVLLDVMDGLVEAPEDRAAIAEVRGRVSALEDNFERTIVPAIGGPQAALVAPHDRALALVDEITARIDALNLRFRQRADEAQQRADVAHRSELVWHTTLVLVAAIFAAAIGVYLTRAIARPLADLQRGAASLASGRLGTRIPVPADDDLGALAGAFNTMARDLEAREAALVAAEKLASIGRVAAGIAHEINNPLAVVIGHARLLERSADRATADDARRIGLEAERCQEIVQGLLDLARPARLAPSEVELGELVHDVAESLAHAGLPCAVELAGAPLVVEGDARRLRQIVTNLLRNALEAAPGQPVAVTLGRAEALVEMRVSDRGEGIPPSLAGQLFEPFQTSKASGTGLGLAVSRSLARAHGGDLALAPGRPTTFVLSLPATPGEGRS